MSNDTAGSWNVVTVEEDCVKKVVKESIADGASEIYVRRNADGSWDITALIPPVAAAQTAPDPAPGPGSDPSPS